MERLVFGYGTARHKRRDAGAAADTDERRRAAAAPLPPVADPGRRQRRAARLGLPRADGLHRAALLPAAGYVRPRCAVLHLAEVAAISRWSRWSLGRLRRGLPVTRLTPELIGVLALGVLILATAPFSVWMGGAIGTFTDLYVKVVLIFVLMVNTLTSPRPMQQFTWLIVLASGYIGGRAVLDYARGINLIENGRVQGCGRRHVQEPERPGAEHGGGAAAGRVPVLRPLAPGETGAAALCAFLMVGAVVASHSRSGPSASRRWAGARRAAAEAEARPGLRRGDRRALALPLLPSSYWQRLASITDKELDQTGSREARRSCSRSRSMPSLAHPLTGVGRRQVQDLQSRGARRRRGAKATT